MPALEDTDDRLAAWHEAVLAGALLAINPSGLGGIILKAGPSPQREAWEAAYRSFLSDDAPFVRVPLGIDRERLIGGYDLGTALMHGELKWQPGLLSRAHGGTLSVSAASALECAELGSICQALDHSRDGHGSFLDSSVQPSLFGTVVWDDECDDNHSIRTMLRDRLAFSIDLAGISYRETGDTMFQREDVFRAKELLHKVVVQPDFLAELCEIALALGVTSIRSELYALACARSLAALDGRKAVKREDVSAAIRLVLLPRATQLPDFTPEQEMDCQEELQPSDNPEETEVEPQQLEQSVDAEDLIVEAIANSHVDLDFIRSLARSNSGRLAGRLQRARVKKAARHKRGRPAGTRRARKASCERLNILATLRAAAPWQRIRAQTGVAAVRGANDRKPVIVKQEDFRVVKYKNAPQVTVIFVVDASGSTAIGRLAEAKGAVETLLSDSYRRRDEVAVISFRGEGAELLLPPTRALARARRSLSMLPGGGATPLAAGITLQQRIAHDVVRSGRTPIIVLITDGRPNVALSGEISRPQAREDAIRTARIAGSNGWPTLLLDASKRRDNGFTQELATVLGADHKILPQLTSKSVASTVQSALQETLRSA
ncbi:MAG: VWA domain-containing protein [Pseudomonadota bacterium]